MTCVLIFYKKNRYYHALIRKGDGTILKHHHTRLRSFFSILGAWQFDKVILMGIHPDEAIVQYVIKPACINGTLEMFLP